MQRDLAASWLGVPIEVWNRRGADCDEYGATLADAAPLHARIALEAVMHMTHNRWVGIDPAYERSTLDLVRACCIALRERAPGEQMNPV